MGDYHLNRSDFQRLFVDTEVDFTPDAPLGASMLTRVPFALSLDLDPRVVDEKVQRARRAAEWDVHRKSLLTALQGAEVRHRPIKPRQSQEAFNKARRLAKRHPEHHFHDQARLDRGVAERLRSTALAGRFGIPVHLGIEPDRQ